MENLLYTSIIVASFYLIIVNELILWKIWPRIFFPDISTGRKALVATFIIDPLIATIICPLASDLYFAQDWLQTCDFYLVFTVFLAIFVMYGSSLVMSFKMISTLVPTNQNVRVDYKPHHFTILICFMTSLLVNLILTWITFSLTMQGAETFNPSEECFPYMVHDKVFFVCGVSFCFQVLFTVSYAHLNATVHRRVRSIFLDTSSDISINDGVASSLLSWKEGTFKHALLTYSAISLICLFLSHCLRSAFVICSCLPFLQMTTGIYWTNWLIVAKLPCFGLLYFTVSKFI